jgi:hypothetical protein
VVIVDGDATTETEVMVIGTATVTTALANLEVSWVEVAVIVAIPADAGANTPALLTLPMFDGLTDQLTALLYLPVPDTESVQAAVWVVKRDVGEQATPTEVTAMGMAIVTVMLPDLVSPKVSGVDVAVIVAVPAVAGVKTPALLMLPMLDGLTDQLTLGL